MPHQCTSCGHVFADGSKEMLSGCPDCGGNKFQFRPAGASDETVPSESTASTEATPTDQSPNPPERSGANASSVAETVGRATTKVRDFVSSDSKPQSEPNPNAEWPGDWNSDPREPDPSPGTETPPASGGNDEVADDDSNGDTNSDIDDDADIIDADARRHAGAYDEDLAQASARTDVVSSDELNERAQGRDRDDSTISGDLEDFSNDSSKDASEDVRDDGPEDTAATTPEVASDGTIVSEPTGEEADLADLREQLNDQFESIKVLEPGQYELNLMELYDREEYIIALQENGRYVIQVPEQWIGDDPDDR